MDPYDEDNPSEGAYVLAADIVEAMEERESHRKASVVDLHVPNQGGCNYERSHADDPTPEPTAEDLAKLEEMRRPGGILDPKRLASISKSQLYAIESIFAAHAP